MAQPAGLEPLLIILIISTGLVVNISLSSVVSVFAEVQYSLGLPH